MRPTAPLPVAEFVALMAFLMATTAFAIDAMLPAMPGIAAELSPEAPRRAQLIVPSFVFGLGCGTLVMGPLSDSFGRRKVLVWGAAVFWLGAILAARADTLTAMLAARVVQGVGAAAARVVAVAIIRDLHSGRQMARMLSFVLIVFSLVPAFAPTIGAAIITISGWRSVFIVFLIFSALSVIWLLLRQPETLLPNDRRAFRVSAIRRALGDVLGNATVRRVIAMQVLIFGALFSVLSSTQMVFDEAFGRGDSFPLWFGVMAVFGAVGGFLNSRLVLRLGMRDVVIRALSVFVLLSTLFVGAAVLSLLPGALYFPAFVVWQIAVFATAAMTLGNLNALAMEPLGHVAGTAASAISALSTVGAVAVAAPVSLMFDGTPLPLATGGLCCGALALALGLSLKQSA